MCLKLITAKPWLRTIFTASASSFFPWCRRRDALTWGHPCAHKRVLSTRGRGWAAPDPVTSGWASCPWGHPAGEEGRSTANAQRQGSEECGAKSACPWAPRTVCKPARRRQRQAAAPRWGTDAAHQAALTLAAGSAPGSPRTRLPPGWDIRHYHTTQLQYCPAVLATGLPSHPASRWAVAHPFWPCEEEREPGVFSRLGPSPASPLLPVAWHSVSNKLYRCPAQIKFLLCHQSAGTSGFSESRIWPCRPHQPSLEILPSSPIAPERQVTASMGLIIVLVWTTSSALCFQEGLSTAF